MVMKMNKKTMWKVLLAVFAAGFLLAVGFLVVRRVQIHSQEEKLKALAEQTNTESTESTENLPVPESTETQTAVTEGAELTLEEKFLKLEEAFDIEIPRKELDFVNLREEINPDIYAWIYIPDTKIDYPVLQHPTDNFYYLQHNLDGTKGYPGCIYTEDYNAKDFSDVNTVLYGHNMKDGSMFAGLHKYGDEEYMAEHPHVFIYTEDDVFVYEIYAAYEYGNEHLLYNYDFSNERIFEDYLEKVKELRTMNRNFRDDIEVDAQDKIVTLSTCIANKADSRYLVQGVLLHED